ncbi:MAG: SGNH/GDSL hydrolase family protein, partial [Peristeroidobacter soli]
AGLCVVGATIMPRADAVPVLYGWDIAAMEPQREKLNELIRGSHAFDALADFDAVMRNPLLPSLPFTPYYFADQLHPNSLGFLVMANAVPIEALVPPPQGNCNR